MTKGDHPPGWSETALCCIAEITLGQSPPGASYNKTGMGVPFFQGKAEFGDFYPTVKKWTTAPKKRAKQGDILLSVRAPVGPTNLAPFDCAIGRGLHAIRPLDGIDRNFILWSLRASEHRLRQIATGSTFNAVTGLQVKNHKICIAPYREQGQIVERIEELFARLDAVDASLASLLEKLETLRSAILADAFHTNRPLPPGWRVVTIGSVCKVVNGSTPKTSIPSYWGGDISWITPKDLAGHSGKYIARGERSITQAGYASCSAQLLPKGTVLFTSRAPIGYTAILAEPACTNQGFKSFVPSSQVASGYLYWYLRHTAPTIEKMGSGTTFKELSKRVATEIPLVLAPTEQQHSITQHIDSYVVVMRSVEMCLASLRSQTATLRQSVLAEAFAGRLVPQDPNDEPASALLDRIAASRQTSTPPRKVRA